MQKAYSTDKRLGILGGGQLGRMLIQKAIDFNLHVSVLDPDDQAPCKSIASEFTVGDFNDFDTVYRWGKNHHLITIEIEHVSTEALVRLENEGIEIYPQPSVIKMVQDKGLQKVFYHDHQIPTAPFTLVEGKKELLLLNKPFPYILKTRKAGYDGKGVKKIKDHRSLENCFDEPCVVEDLVDFAKEISVIVARNKDGEIVYYPPVEMEFNEEANLVEYLFSPAAITPDVYRRAVSTAATIIAELKMVGLLAVEMFVTRQNEVLVNEIAPRPHNSGHQTIEGNVTSQYEQHLRAIFNLPLGSTDVVRPSVMVNLLGEKNYTGPARYEGLNEALALPGTYIHLYGKIMTKPFRKMGHVTVTANDINDAMRTARIIKDTVKVIA